MDLAPSSKLFDQLDSNHDGVLSMSEFAALQARQQQFGGSPLRPPLQTSAPTGGYQFPSQSSLRPLAPSAGPTPLAYKVSDTLSPLVPGTRPGGSTSPLPSLCGTVQNPLCPSSLVSADGVSPPNEPERTFARINDESPEASFEQKMEMLDRKENELQVLQMKMIAEQAQTFNRDVAAMKKMMQGMKEHVEGLQVEMTSIHDSLARSHCMHDEHTQRWETLKGHSASPDERIKYLETVVGDSFSKHEKMLKGLRDAHDGHARDLADVKAKTMQIEPTSLEQRIEYVEKLLGDGLEKHDVELRALKDGHQKLFKDTDDIKVHTIHHASFEQRMDLLEKCIGDNADRHDNNADRHDQALKAIQEKHEAHSQGLDELQQLPERMKNYVERMLGESSSNYGKKIARLEAACDKHASDVSGLKVASNHHATIQERVDYLEKIMGDSAEKHDCELKVLRDAHANHTTEWARHHKSFEERFGNLENGNADMMAKHSLELDAMKAHYNGYMAKFEKQSGSLSLLHSGLKERMDHFEQRHGLTSENMNTELNSIKDALAQNGQCASQHAEDVESLKAQCQQLSSSTRENARRTQELEGSRAQHLIYLDSAMAHIANGMPVYDRVKQLEVVLAERIKELDMLKDGHSEHSRMLEGVNCNTTDRLDAIERVLAFTADERLKQTDEALKTTFDMYEQMRDRPGR